MVQCLTSHLSVLATVLAVAAASPTETCAGQAECMASFEEDDSTAMLHLRKDDRKASRTSPPVACTEWECKNWADQYHMKFSSVKASNGAPAGCVEYKSDNKLVWVETCENQQVCGTASCNGCTSWCQTPSTPVYTPCTKKTCQAEAKSKWMDFEVQQTSNGAPSGCIIYNSPPKMVWVQDCANHANCETETCHGCEVYCNAAVPVPY